MSGGHPGMTRAHARVLRPSGGPISAQRPGPGAGERSKGAVGPSELGAKVVDLPAQFDRFEGETSFPFRLGLGIRGFGELFGVAAAVFFNGRPVGVGYPRAGWGVGFVGQGRDGVGGQVDGGRPRDLDALFGGPAGSVDQDGAADGGVVCRPADELADGLSVCVGVPAPRHEPPDAVCGDVGGVGGGFDGEDEPVGGRCAFGRHGR